jgi:hypothetical protein
MRSSTATISQAQLRQGNLHTLAIPAVFLSIIIYAIYCALIDVASGSLIERLALVKLESSLKTSSDQEIDTALKTIQQGRLQRSLAGIFPTSSFEESQRDEVISNALLLRAALLKGAKPAIKQALQEFNHGFLSRNHALTRSSKNQLLNLQRLLRGKISSYQNATIFYQKSLQTKHRLTEEQHSQKTRFELISQDLLDLFSLSGQLRTQAAAFTFYTQGALNELPFLPGIPDNLSDFVSLRTELENQGGKVRIEGENAHELFLAKLDGLRVISREIALNHQELIKNQSTNMSALTKARTELQIAKEALLLTTNQLILTLVEA